MATISKEDFLADLRSKVQENCEMVTAVFQTLPVETLQAKPDPKEWNILQCIDHLNLTHDYYTPKIETALANPAAKAVNDGYKPSFWGRIYMFFSLNPRYSFPAAEEIAPEDEVTPAALSLYLAKQELFIDVLDRVSGVDLARTRVPITTAVNFNLGDCFKILAYHDALHLGQARRVLQALQ